MNANELADCIEFDAPIVGINKEAATMLRQQQAEIEALKIKHDAIACSSCACGFIKRGKAQEK
jgi:hypothetical protein